MGAEVAFPIAALLAFCPPGPDDRIKLSVTARSSIAGASLIRIT
ncbi:MAG: hypothetical protein ACREF3_06545 [Acetobacteraceae bacterium]